MDPPPTASGTFGYHEGATVRLVLLMLAVYIPVELLLVDSLVPAGRLWVQLLHGAVWLLILLLVSATYLSMKHRPHRVSEEGLELHRGFWGHVRVPAESVLSVELLPEPAGIGERRQRRPDGVTAMTVRGVPEVELRLDAPVTPLSFTGPRPETRIIRVSVNDRQGFEAAVRTARAGARRARGLA